MYGNGGLADCTEDGLGYNMGVDAGRQTSGHVEVPGRVGKMEYNGVCADKAVVVDGEGAGTTLQDCVEETGGGYR